MGGRVTLLALGALLAAVAAAATTGIIIGVAGGFGADSPDKRPHALGEPAAQQTATPQGTRADSVPDGTRWNRFVIHQPGGHTPKAQADWSPPPGKTIAQTVAFGGDATGERGGSKEAVVSQGPSGPGTRQVRAVDFQDFKRSPLAFKSQYIGGYALATVEVSYVIHADGTRDDVGLGYHLTKPGQHELSIGCMRLPAGSLVDVWVYPADPSNSGALASSEVQTLGTVGGLPAVISSHRPGNPWQSAVTVRFVFNDLNCMVGGAGLPLGEALKIADGWAIAVQGGTRW